jgi:hypothetical protein
MYWMVSFPISPKTVRTLMFRGIDKTERMDENWTTRYSMYKCTGWYLFQ